MNDDDYKIMPFEYKPVEYDNYEMDEYGNLDFTQPDKNANIDTSTTITKPQITRAPTLKATSSTETPPQTTTDNKPKKKKKRRHKLSHRYGISYGVPMRARPIRPRYF